MTGGEPGRTVDAHGGQASAALLRLAQAGDRAALDQLVARYLPRLQRWATGRLPRWARDIADTHDIVQETVVQTIGRLEAFEPRGDGALQAYLRQGVLNRIRDELRRAGRRPPRAPLGTDEPDRHGSPLEAAIGRQAVERYETALRRLRPEDREAIVARVELGFSHKELALVLDKPSANAARMTVERAMVRLAREMQQDDPHRPNAGER